MRCLWCVRSMQSVNFPYKRTKKMLLTVLISSSSPSLSLLHPDFTILPLISHHPLALPPISHSTRVEPLQVYICCLTGQIEDLSVHNFLPIYSVAGLQTALITKVTNKLRGNASRSFSELETTEVTQQRATDRKLRRTWECRPVGFIFHVWGGSSDVLPAVLLIPSQTIKTEQWFVFSQET